MSRHRGEATQYELSSKSTFPCQDYLVTDDATVPPAAHTVSVRHTHQVLRKAPLRQPSQCPQAEAMTSLSFSPALARGPGCSPQQIQPPPGARPGRSPPLPAQCGTCGTNGSCSGSEQMPGLEWPRRSDLMFRHVTTFLGTQGKCHESQRTVKRLCLGVKM